MVGSERDDLQGYALLSLGRCHAGDGDVTAARTALEAAAAARATFPPPFWTCDRVESAARIELAALAAE